MLTRDQIEQAITAQESLRPVLGDATVDAVIHALQEKIQTLEAAGLHTEQRKLTTILFADTVSSTALSEKLDPEDVLEIMDGALRAYADAVAEHEGVVARLMGDGLLAFFGAPVAREDDTVRAVRCGLAIIRAARRYAQTVEAHWGLSSFDVRVGINTGLVALGEVGGQAGSEWTAMGDAINLAARLQSAAPAGGMLISADTHGHVRGMFEARLLNPITLKGKSEPVSVYLVEREKPRTFRVVTRGIEGIETQMVGRETELRRLQSIFDWTYQEQETQIVTVIGEPGVGKSRLLREFDSWLDERPESIVYFTGRATIDMLKLPYSLIRNVFSFRFQIQENDAAVTVRDKLERGVANFLGTNSTRKAHLIGHLIGFDFASSSYLQGEDPQQLTQLGLHAVVELFSKIARQSATVIFLDDIHWADDKSLDLVNRIARAQRQLRLLIVCLARPALYERRLPAWMTHTDIHQLIELRPLSREDTARLVRDILQRAEQVPDNLVQRIVNVTDGNPFYVEEIIKMLLDDGVILKGDSHWHIDPTRLDDLRIPSTLTGVLQARLDALPPEERDVLQRASVVGRIFWDQAVQRLRTEEMPPIQHLAAVLESLRHRELIRAREESAFTGAKEYIFRHTILHDVTYESVLRRQRRVYHAQVGDWLAENAKDRLSEFTGRIADHYEYAGQTQKAVTYLTRAVEQSVNIGAFREALTFAERGLTLVGQIQHPAHDQEGQLKFQLGRAHRGLSEYDVARDLYQEALVLFTLVNDKQGIVRVLYELGWLVGYIQRHYAAGVEYFRESLACAEEIQDLRGIAWAYNGLGVMAYFQRDRFEAIHYYEQSLSIAREIGDQIRAAGALNNLGLVKRELGRYNDSRLDLESSRSLFDAIGSHNEAIAPIVNLGNLSRVLGQHEEAEGYFQEALVTVREIGDRASMASILNSMGNLQRAKGDFQAAQALYLEALLLAREIGVPAGIATILEGLALLARLVGHYDEAETHLREILALAQANGSQNEVANALMNLGGVLRVQERLLEAREVLEQSVMLNMDNLNRESLARAMYYLGEVSAAQGQNEAAERYYRDALALYREFDNRSGLALALGGLGEVNIKQGEMVLGREFLQEAYRIATMVRDTPLVLWLLTVVAGYMLADDEPIRAAELIGMVLYHPALPDEARMRAHHMRASLGHAATIQTAIRRGEARVAANQAVILDEPLWPSVLQAQGL